MSRRPRLLSADDCIGRCTPGVHTYREGCIHSPYAGGDAPAPLAPIGLRPFLDGCVGTHDLGPSCDFKVVADPFPAPASPSKPLVRTLEWVMTLRANGCTEHSLVTAFRAPKVRWGWIVNATDESWTAHVGDFGQAATVGEPAPDLTATIANFDFTDLARAKAWVENEVALQWKNQHQTETPT